MRGNPTGPGIWVQVGGEVAMTVLEELRGGEIEAVVGDGERRSWGDGKGSCPFIGPVLEELGGMGLRVVMRCALRWCRPLTRRVRRPLPEGEA